MKKLSILVALAMLSACSGRSGAEKAVREVLKDPESARFGEFYFNSKSNRGCLGVNAKNSWGAYTGEQMAQVEKIDGKWEVLSIGELSLETCRQIFADVQPPSLEERAKAAADAERDASEAARDAAKHM